ncbi:hypothetical protein SAMN05421866_3296 [Chryseobacterium oranimense]|uniref:Uncharacterized protein n=1 Tax=Chryseobacterium oranimense TaxID=421058 RepID=A0A1M5UN82_9FLAO|nr:hypothetical protein [Chryseobacterium oranimense]SHH64183.1 hypothetical protein SAMN05421866_3296 [Chryseobacterium oranimense]
MKKILFIAALGVAGLASANGNGNVEKEVNPKAKEVAVTKNTKKAKKIAKIKQVECGVFQASCTSAYTCQDWTPSQWYHWMEQIQENYCQL